MSIIFNSSTTMPKPHRDVYTIIAGATADQKGRWVKIGVSFLNNDGSESVLLDALPVNGKLQLRTPKAKDSPEPQTA